MKPTQSVSAAAHWRRVVAEVEAAAAPGGRRRLGLCVVEGTRLFERALRAGARVEQALCSSSFATDEGRRAVELRRSLEERECAPIEVADEVLERLTDGRSLGGIVGLARIPSPPSLPEVLAADPNARFLACVAFNDPGNVGALVRTAHAGGAAAVLAVGGTDAFHPKALRTSMGSLFRVPVLEWPDWASCAADLRRAGVRRLGALTRGGADPRDLPRAEGPLALVLGSEAFGLSAADRAGLDGAVTLPMAAGVDSLSVNAAAAVLLWTLARAD